MNQLEYIKQQIEALRNQMDTLNTIISDYNSSKKTVEAMEAGTDEEVLVPIGGMTIVKAKMVSTDTIMVDQGAGIYTEEGLESAKKRIDERIKKVREAMTHYENTIKQLSERYNQILRSTQNLRGAPQSGQEEDN